MSEELAKDTEKLESQQETKTEKKMETESEKNTTETSSEPSKDESESHGSEKNRNRKGPLAILLRILRKTVGYTARLISILALVAVFVLGYMLIQTILQTKKVQETSNQLQIIRQTSIEENTDGDWSHGMLNINRDYAGWLTVYGTPISEPVVLGETNDTYLRTDIYREHSEAGTLFLDETTDLDRDGNLIIYGHKMNDKTMFGCLDVFKDPDFFKDNGMVCWEGKEGKKYYEIFALMVVPGYSTAEDFIDLQGWNNVMTEHATSIMLETVKERASIYRELKFDPAVDRYLFLVTCDYNINDGRMVLVARRLDGIKDVPEEELNGESAEEGAEEFVEGAAEGEETAE